MQKIQNTTKYPRRFHASDLQPSEMPDETITHFRPRRLTEVSGQLSTILFLFLAKSVSEFDKFLKETLLV